MFSPPQLIPDALLTTYPPKCISLSKKPHKTKIKQAKDQKDKNRKQKKRNERKKERERKKGREKKRKAPQKKTAEFVLCWPTTLEPESALEGALYWTQ